MVRMTRFSRDFIPRTSYEQLSLDWNHVHGCALSARNSGDPSVLLEQGWGKHNSEIWPPLNDYFFLRMLWGSVIAPWLFAPAPEESVDEKKQKKLDRKLRRAHWSLEQFSQSNVELVAEKIRNIADHIVKSSKLWHLMFRTNLLKSSNSFPIESMLEPKCNRNIPLIVRNYFFTMPWLNLLLLCYYFLLF